MILSVNNTEVKLKLNAGAEVNIILIKAYKTLASITRISLRKPTVQMQQSDLNTVIFIVSTGTCEIHSITHIGSPG